MQYMALIYADETGWDSLADGEKEAVYGRYRSLADEARAAGVMVGGNELRPTRDATAVRVRGSEPIVTDGPYAEVKEALGGFFLFQCESIEAALDWAARIPAAEHGAVEVRPVYVDPAEVQP